MLDYQYMRFFSLLFLLFLFGPSPSYGQVTIRMGKLSLQTQMLNSTVVPNFEGRGRKCVTIFSRPNVGKAFIAHMKMGGADLNDQVYAEASLEGIEANIGGNIITVNSGRTSKFQKDFFEKAVGQWNDYTPEQINLLRYLNGKILPHRQHSVSYEFDKTDLPDFPIEPHMQGVAAVRAMDGSTPNVLVAGVNFRPNIKVETTPEGIPLEALTPIEVAPHNQQANYILPFRSKNPSEPSYIWHLGIGTNIKFFKGGLATMFSHLANFLDMHYNTNYFQTFGSTKILDSKNMMIVSSAKPDMVPHYQAIGFDVHTPNGKVLPNGSRFQVDSHGEAQLVGPFPLLPDGMVLIAMPAPRFIKLYYGKSTIPMLELDTIYGSYRMGGKDDNQTRRDRFFLKANRKIHSRIPRITTRQQLIEAIQNLIHLNNVFGIKAKQFIEQHQNNLDLQKEWETYHRDPEYMDLVHAWRAFAKLYFQIAKGTSSQLRSLDWQLIEMYATSQLTDFPLKAFMETRVNQQGIPDYIEVMTLVIQ